MKSGVQSKLPVPSVLSVKVAPLGRAEVDRAGIVLSGSEAETEKLRLTPSVVPLEPMAARSGAWLPASVTVITTASLSVSEPSVA